MKFSKIPLRNLLHRRGRTVVLTVLVALLAFSLFAGAYTMLSLHSGIESLEARLGADIIVVPSSAKSKVDLDNILLQGTAGYFYMSADYFDKIKQTEGVEQASAQIFLASLKASCCSVAVQVIGFDPEADFTVQPWVEKKYNQKLETYDVIVGDTVNAEVGDSITIYEKNCRVVARLDRTGTGMDTAIYTTFDTIRLLLSSAQELGHDLKISGDPSSVISAVYIKTSEETDVESVANDINLHVRKVQAVETKNMLSTVSNSMTGISSALILLIGVVWILVFLIIIFSFIMITRERRLEFATLRVIGVSRKMLAQMIRKETAIVCLLGSIIGVLLGCLVVFPFGSLIELSLGLPFLTPKLSTAAGLAAGTVMGALVTGSLASLWTVHRIGHLEASTILREGN
ncbi:MAG: FtsX-like permease family protein [Lachnospiraceae bacterium]|nr:FtsX-like permease family protein [Lachnospiraceae bacterium]